jgi:hypothetical protein
MLAMAVDTDFDVKLRRLAEMPDLIVKSVRAALSDTVDDLHTRELMEIEQVFDRPTPYVKRGVKKKYPGKAGVLQAGIYVEEWPFGHSPADILRPHVFGGGRRMKASENKLKIFSAAKGGWTAMSPGYPRNGHGNIPAAKYSQMLNEVGALLDVPTKKRTAAENRAKRGWQFFVYRNSSGEPIGIMEKRGPKKAKMMLAFVSQPGYRKNVQFDYRDIAKRQIAYSLPLHFNRIIGRYMSRL